MKKQIIIRNYSSIYFFSRFKPKHGNRVFHFVTFFNIIKSRMVNIWGYFCSTIAAVHLYLQNVNKFYPMNIFRAHNYGHLKNIIFCLPSIPV